MIILAVVLSVMTLGYLINRVTAMPAARGVRVSQVLAEARVIAHGSPVERRAPAR